jgi:lysophospholipase L1-like esterase
MLLAAALAFAVQAADDDVVRLRGGLPNFPRTMARAQAGEKNEKGDALTARVVYFGGSITAGAGASKAELSYRGLFTKHLKSLHPKAPLLEHNAALGGTGSWLGAFRAKADIMDHWLYADLVIVEFAVNDGGAPEAQVVASMEGIVRQLRRRYPLADLVFVYTLVKGHLDAFKAGRLPERMEWHERVAEHYGIPSVNVARYAARRILAGELTIDEFAKDGVHPTDRGYALYQEALAAFYARVKAAPEPVKHPMPAPLSPAPMERAQMVPYEKAAFDDGWLGWQLSPVSKFMHVLASDKPGAVVSLKFKGSAVGWYDVIGPDTGDYEYSLDGGPWTAKANWDVHCKGYSRAHSRLVAEGLDPGVEHELKLRIAEKQPAESKGRRQRIAYFLVDGDVVWEDPYKGLDPLARIDGVYQGIPPLRYEPPAGRWDAIPKTMEKLRNGPALTIVMLGDSIVNDTSSSRWELLAGRLYPKCAIKKVVSVRGSTGCWWYKEAGRVQDYVLAHKPDLLMIGGISQRDDVDSIRSVIEQVRAASPETEYLLMTGAFGSVDPVADAAFAESVSPDGSTYRSKLMKLAGEQKAAFIDVTGIWGKYIRECGKPRLWFMRDPVHANERGFQVLGRILERWLAP